MVKYGQVHEGFHTRALAYGAYIQLLTQTLSKSLRSELNRWSAEIGGEIHEASQKVSELRTGSGFAQAALFLVRFNPRETW